MAILFQPNEMTMFEMIAKSIAMEAIRSRRLLFFALVKFVVLIAVFYVEIEIIFRTFESLSGGESGDEEYWSPSVMSLSALIVITAYHQLASNKPNSVLVRFVETAAKALIPIYLIGIGLYIAGLLDVFEMLRDYGIPPIGEVPKAVEGTWIETTFNTLTSEGAAMMFSIGLGGLAIINIFVSHNLISEVHKSLETSQTLLSIKKEAAKELKIVRAAHRVFAKLGADLADISIRADERYQRMAITATTLEVVSDALEPHKALLSRYEIEGEQPEFAASALSGDPKKIAKSIAKIESITAQDILAHLNLDQLEKS